ncbi:FtsL-like putative cell division protein [Mucilaginibacter antarcticus]
MANGFIAAEDATRALPFILFLAFLGMIYIANRHLAEKNIRDIAKLTKEVHELTWEYKVTKADLAFKSTQSEVAKRADTLGVKESIQPAQKITVKEDAIQ